MRADGITEECMKFLGLGIYNSHMNICFGDGFYLNSLYKKYGKEEVDAEIKRLRKDNL